MEKNELRKKLLNDSGFLLQLAVEREIKKLTYGSRPVFESVVLEYPWLDPQSTKKFIDLIVTQCPHPKTEIRFVIECKRSSQDWIFLTSAVPEATTKGMFPWIRTIVTPGRFPHQSLLGHFDFPLISGFLHSEFCVVQGQGKDRPLLEHTSGDLLNATEALSSEDSNTCFKFSQDLVKIYIPVLVTTATLAFTVIDPEEISLSHGEVNEAEFRETSPVLFRKSFVADRVRTANTLSLRLSKAARERSVLVVNAEHLTEVLVGFQIHWTWLMDEHQDRLPWD